MLLGVLLGGTLCVTYLRQEIAAGISPKLKRVEITSTRSRASSTWRCWPGTRN
jgi:hypothetical protein